jgi:hypothetical protein
MDEGLDWIHVAQVRDSRLAFVNTVMNLPVSQKGGKFLDKLSILLSFQEFCFMN